MTGWAAYDQEDHPLARRLYTEAEQLASASGNAEIMVHLHGNLAQQSTYLAGRTRRRGLAREALRFADRAAAAARHEPSPRLHAMVALRRARAHAELGDEQAFRVEIGNARRELDRGSHPSDSSLTEFVTNSEISGVEGGGYEAIGRVRDEPTERPVTLYRAVLDDPTRSPRDHAGYHASFARALLAAGDRTEAINQGMTLLPDLGERIISARALNNLRPVRAAAERAAAEEFCARFDAAERALAG